MAGDGDLIVGRIEYLNDPSAPKPNTLVPACGTLAVNEHGEILPQRRRDTGHAGTTDVYWRIEGLMEVILR
ncbi:MAG TPA: hypothetical protein VGP31_05855 [Planosporangium sp.]|nr:hypothetical protein [Planosporangium sp.]